MRRNMESKGILGDMAFIEQYWHIWLVVLPLVFLGAVVDSIAGGGGLISLPAYMMVLPPHVAAATNKFAASFGTLSSLLRFLKSGKVHLRISLIAAAGALIGSPIGAQVQMWIPDERLNQIMVVVLPCVAVFVAMRRDLGVSEDRPVDDHDRKTMAQAFAIGLVIGAYDGLVGPGTGTFLIIAFSTVLGWGLLSASGSAKVVNFASNISALVVYLIHGQVLFAVGIPALIVAILGYQVGARMALRGGGKVVRYLIFVVLGIMIIKTGCTMFGDQLQAVFFVTHD